jgi:hypothetical protein
MSRHLRNHYGNMFHALAAAHILVAIIDFRREWADLFRRGFFNKVNQYDNPRQELGYWFLLLGPLLSAIGVLARALLETTGAVPRAFSWIVATTSFVAAFAMYLNGMWIVGLLGLLGLKLAKPAPPSRAQVTAHHQSLDASGDAG